MRTRFVLKERNGHRVVTLVSSSPRIFLLARFRAENTEKCGGGVSLADTGSLKGDTRHNVCSLISWNSSWSQTRKIIRFTAFKIHNLFIINMLRITTFRINGLRANPLQPHENEEF